MRACGAGTLAIYMKAGDREKRPVSFSVHKKGGRFSAANAGNRPRRFFCAAGTMPGRLFIW